MNFEESEEQLIAAARDPCVSRSFFVVLTFDLPRTKSAGNSGQNDKGMRVAFLPHRSV